MWRKYIGATSHVHDRYRKDTKIDTNDNFWYLFGTQRGISHSQQTWDVDVLATKNMAYKDLFCDGTNVTDTYSTLAIESIFKKSTTLTNFA